MLNYDTLLSSYDDKLTLMQWLKKVEAALAGAALASVSIEQPTETSAVLTFHFADGTALSSPSLILPKGEQGESVKSAYIKDGNLHLVLTNGDDLGAGNMFNGDVTLSGNLTAAEVTAGDITAADVTADGVDARSIKTPMLTSDKPEISAEKPVVEVMDGYSFERGYSGSTYDINVTYASAVKNGNKLTLALAFSIKLKSDTIDDAFPIVGKFTIPSSLFNRLVPDVNGRVDYKRVIFVKDIPDSSLIPLVMTSYKKEGKVNIDIIAPNDALSLNKIYYSRYEVTFLLSDNMAA